MVMLLENAATSLPQTVQAAIISFNKQIPFTAQEAENSQLYYAQVIPLPQDKLTEIVASLKANQKYIPQAIQAIIPTLISEIITYATTNANCL